jgi:DNA polymerase/3'-5' exonuclease PolX
VTETTAKRRVPLALAEAVAQEALEALASACLRIEVAGSIRRRRPDVADIELVAVPRTAPILDLLGEPRGERDLLDELCRQLLHDGILTHRYDTAGHRAFGAKYKRVGYHGRAGALPLDLFVVTPPAQWGVLLAIRTGPGGYSKRLVTPRSYHGGMPAGMQVFEGALWGRGGVVDTPEEEDFFRALGLVWLPPEQRTDAARLLSVRPAGPSAGRCGGGAAHG